MTPSLALTRGTPAGVAVRLLAVGVAFYAFPLFFLAYLGLGLLDFRRNSDRSLAALDRYFTGNGLLTWILCPFNLFMDVVTLPNPNRRIYALSDLPQPYQDEIAAVIDAARRRDLVTALGPRMQDTQRGMLFFKWYGKNLPTTVDVPEFHREYRYVQTIGVSIFNTREATGKHFGPARITLRVLYNINDLASEDAYIVVGTHINRWRDSKLFIFDDTLEHESRNESNEMRYCMFVDILRPSPFPGLMRAFVRVSRVLVGRLNTVFYKGWVFMR